MRESFPLGGGRHHFFPKRSFKATLSSIASASRRFRRAFSSSRVFRRLASETSIPPYLALPLVDAGVADAAFTAKVSNRKPCFVLLQDGYDLLFRKPTMLHVLVLKLGQNELQTGLNRGGKVTDGAVVLPWSSPRGQHHAAVARKAHLTNLFRFPEPPLRIMPFDRPASPGATWCR